MSRAPETLALVLSGGGARAAYQVGVLAGIAERVGGEFRFPIITGVSAGAINAGFLAAHQPGLADTIGALEQAWLGLAIPGVFRSGPLSLLASLSRWLCMLAAGRGRGLPRVRGVLDTRPLRQTLTRYVSTEGIETNVAAGRLRALALSMTSYETGRTVTYVHGPGDPPTWERVGRIARHRRIGVDHVLASCALPILFPAVGLEGSYYGDGSMRQTAPLAPAIHLGARRLLAVSVRHGGDGMVERSSRDAGYPPPAQVLGMMLNAIFLDALETDSERLERVNRSLALLPAGSRHPEGLRPVELAVLRPSRDLGELSADLLPCLPWALRWLVRRLGASELRAPDLLSYLLFERPYIERLIELGRADARVQWDRIAPTLEED